MKKRRRSSLALAAEAVGDVVERRRSSFETIMHLNVIEDIARRNADESIPEEDMVALNKTLSSLNGKSHKTE